jgi:hypothetical protein
MSSAPSAVLIGGWGTWMRLHGEMSHDIDLIVDHGTLAVLEPLLDGAVSKSAHLGNKRAADYRGVHVDLYLKYESTIGRNMVLRPEFLARYSEVFDGTQVLSLEAQIVTKLCALVDRPNTMKGQKDRHEIIGLLKQDADPSLIGSLTVECSDASNIVDVLGDAFEYLSEYEPDTRESSWGRADKSWLRSIRKATLEEAAGTPSPNMDSTPLLPESLLSDTEILLGQPEAFTRSLSPGHSSYGSGHGGMRL